MLNLILIDDDPDEAYIMRQALKKVDDEKTLTHFDDGREFVSSIDAFANTNSLVLLDLNMPQCGRL